MSATASLATAESFLSAHFVRAVRRIEDSPLSDRPSPAAAGACGSIADIDLANDIVFVDFGAGAIACSPDEIAVLRRTPTNHHP